MREKTVSFVFLIMILVFFTLVLLPQDEMASVKENRPLAEMPEITLEKVLSGKFSTEYENYVNDNVSLRSKWVELGMEFEKIRGINLKNSEKIVDLINGMRLILSRGKIMEVYKEKPDVVQKYIDVLNRYSSDYSGKSDVYLMLVPTQIEFNDSQYSILADSQKKTINNIYSSLENVKTVNVYDKLKQHMNEYIYFRTDHHWTQRGGYYGYQALMEAKGEKAFPLEDMTVKKAGTFLGYLYNQANIDEYAQYADEIEYLEAGENYTVRSAGFDNGVPFESQNKMYDIPAIGTGTNYNMFMGGDHQFAQIDTNIKNGQIALVIKDSYANTVIPLMTNNYEKIIVIDPRSYQGTVESIVDEYDVDDIIFINYTLTATLPNFIDSVEKININ